MDRSETACTMGSYTRRPTSRKQSSFLVCAITRAARAAGETRELRRSHSTWPDPLITRTRLLVVLTQYLLGGANCSIPGHVATTVSWCCVRPGPRTIGSDTSTILSMMSSAGMVLWVRERGGGEWRTMRVRGEGRCQGVRLTAARLGNMRVKEGDTQGAVSDERAGQLPIVSGRWTYREGPRME